MAVETSRTWPKRTAAADLFNKQLVCFRGQKRPLKKDDDWQKRHVVFAGV